jgi:hypothetical protein
MGRERRRVEKERAGCHTATWHAGSGVHVAGVLIIQFTAGSISGGQAFLVCLSGGCMHAPMMMRSSNAVASVYPVHECSLPSLPGAGQNSLLSSLGAMACRS